MGALSDYSIGSGTSVSAATALPGLSTGAMRAGDLAYVNDPTGSLVAPSNAFFAFVPWSKTAIAAGNVYYADVAGGDPLKAGRWHRVNTAFAVAPTP